jgi:hypothetical protein
LIHSASITCLMGTLALLSNRLESDLTYGRCPAPRILYSYTSSLHAPGICR